MDSDIGLCLVAYSLFLFNIYIFTFSCVVLNSVLKTTYRPQRRHYFVECGGYIFCIVHLSSLYKVKRLS